MKAGNQIIIFYNLVSFTNVCCFVVACGIFWLLSFLHNFQGNALFSVQNIDWCYSGPKL